MVGGGAGAQEQPGADKGHRQAPELPGGEPEDMAVLRQAEHLGQRTEGGIAEEELAGEATGGQAPGIAEKDPGEEDGALERGLIELRRVARGRPKAAGEGEHDRPGRVGRATEELGVDEVGEAAEQKAGRGEGADQVADGEEGDAT